MQVPPWALLAALAGCSASRAAPEATAANAAPAPTTSAAPRPCTEPGFGANESFQLDRRMLERKPNAAKLLQRLDASPYQYFRALGPQYALRTCAAFRDLRWSLPSVAVHGDPHLEQFAVTPSTAGLEDFDQSGFGPIVIDLVRFAASVQLACREVSWNCRAELVVERWLAAYREALDRPVSRKTPAVVARIRDSTPTDPKGWLDWANGLMRPLSAESERHARAGWADFQRFQREIRPERAAEYHELVRLGALEMGVGSALEPKLLLRLRGASDDPLDDVIIEARSSALALASECSARPPQGGTMWPLLFMSTLGPRMPDIFGVAKLGDESAPTFWVQSWEPGYRELTIADLTNERELVELVEDAARQLAGHFWIMFPEALRATQRYAQLQSFELAEARVRVLARQFAAETVREWEKFRGGAAGAH